MCYWIKAQFYLGYEPKEEAYFLSITVNGFYDGDSTWRVRFMPTELGVWDYVTKSADSGLDGKVENIMCIAPTEPYLHGPLSAQGYHFAHADGTRRFLLSTRMSCHLSPRSEWEEAIDYLKSHCVNLRCS